MENPNRSSNCRVLCAGEALIDLVADAHNRLTPCLGGAVYNLARALALQGVSTGYANPLSQDLYGTQLRHGLAQAGVVVLEAQAVHASTSLALVTLDAQGKAAYSFYRDGIADRMTSASRLMEISHAWQPEVICTGCLALAPTDATTYLPWLAQQKKDHRSIVIDINARPLALADAQVYRANIYAALQYADVIKASDEDLEFMQTSARDLLKNTRANLLLLTEGRQGAQCLTRGGEVFSQSVPADLRELSVQDTVGAGDCFLAGFLACWLKNRAALQVALLHAVRAASMNCLRQGCQPPTWQETQAPIA